MNDPRRPTDVAIDAELAALGAPSGAAPRAGAAALLSTAATVGKPGAAAAGAFSLIAASKLAALLAVVVSVGLVVSPGRPATADDLSTVWAPAGSSATPDRFAVAAPDAPALDVAPIAAGAPVRVAVVTPDVARGATSPIEPEPRGLELLPDPAGLLRAPLRRAAPPRPSLLPSLDLDDELVADAELSGPLGGGIGREGTRLRLAGEATAWRSAGPGLIGPGLSLGVQHTGASPGAASGYIGATLDTAILPTPGDVEAGPRIDVGAQGRGGLALRGAKAGVDVGWTGGVRLLPPAPKAGQDGAVVFPVTGPEVSLVLGRADRARFFASLQLQGGVMDVGGDPRFVPRAALQIGADLPASRRL
jgi:hypothetical protein